jgi:hypothetical protein
MQLPAAPRRLRLNSVAQIRDHPSLGEFSFGSADYDRWSVAIDRIERRVFPSRSKVTLCGTILISGIRSNVTQLSPTPLPTKTP